MKREQAGITPQEENVTFLAAQCFFCIPDYKTTKHPNSWNKTDTNLGTLVINARGTAIKAYINCCNMNL